MNSTNSEFWGYVKDKYTTLKEAYDRILATDVSARWRYNWTGDDERDARLGEVLRAGAQAHAPGLRRDLLPLAPADPLPDGLAHHRAAAARSTRSASRCPNKHHFLVDLEPFGLKNDTADGAVYFAADRPYGLIEATVLRDGAEPKIPVDLTNL